MMIKKTILNSFLRLGPFGVSLFLILSFFTTWIFFRLMLMIMWRESYHDISTVLQTILVSIRFDFLTFSYIVGPFIILHQLYPIKFFPILRVKIFSFLFSIIYFLTALLECGTFPFITEFGNRPDRITFEYLEYPKEVASMLFGDNLLYTLFAFFIPIILTRIFYESFIYLNQKDLKRLI